VKNWRSWVTATPLDATSGRWHIRALQRAYGWTMDAILTEDNASPMGVRGVQIVRRAGVCPRFAGCPVIGDWTLPAWQVEILFHGFGCWLSRSVSTTKTQLEIHLVKATPPSTSPVHRSTTVYRVRGKAYGSSKRNSYKDLKTSIMSSDSSSSSITSFVPVST